jgi:hypothetical protein
MNFINSLTVHKIVEPNKLTGLRTGHMVAQAPYRQVATETYLDNGYILFLDTAAELVLGNDAGAQLKQPFLHYTEELMNGPVLGSKYFTVDLDETLGADKVAYPRAIALYEGDEFTTNNFATALTLAAGTKYFGILVNGILTVVAAVPGPEYKGPLFVAEKDILAAGDAAARFTLIDKHVVATV